MSLYKNKLKKNSYLNQGKNLYFILKIFDKIVSISLMKISNLEKNLIREEYKYP